MNEQGKFEDAIAAYKKAMELNPESTDAHYNLGLILRKQGKLEEAIAHYKTVI